MTPQLFIVPHTHWDREWYEPHDVFRVRLVAMIDGLLDLLESQPRLRFTLDGQAAAFEDYLEIRPEQRDRLAAAVARGQLAVGPFLILLDEFCCDGETIIRNLELGVRASRRLGGELRVGYLPDMFGHAAQMPQLLRGFGIADAALWRGVPDRIRRHAFRWVAPNGDAVRTEYLWDGYGSALKLLEHPDKAAQVVGEYLDTHASWFGGEDVAGMYGTDHMPPRADLVDLLDAYARTAGAVPVRLGTLAELVAARDHTPQALAALPEVVGELRSHARGNLLPGVLSIRTNLKAGMAASERALTTAERLDAQWGSGDHAAFFDLAWYRLVESTAHDSVTGCGVDATAEEVGTRIHVAGHLARGVSDLLLQEAAAATPVGSLLVFNPSGHASDLQVETVAELADSQGPGTQLVAELPTCIGDEHLTASDLDRVIRRIHGQELFGKQIRSHAWSDHGLEFEVADDADGAFDLAEFTAQVRQRQLDDDGRPWRVRTVVPASATLLLQVPAPGLGLVVAHPGGGVDPTAPVVGDAHRLANGRLEVTVEPDGTVTVHDTSSGLLIEGALGLVDEGDGGDSYNAAPLADGVVTAPQQLQVDSVETGPLRGRIRLTRTYLLPVGLDGDDPTRRSSELREQEIDTLLELRAGEDFLRVRVEFVNAVGDHRLRLLVPTGSPASGSVSAGQYGVTPRGRTAEGGWGEFPLPTFPATRFVQAGSAGVLVRKLTEYEVIDAPAALALTMVRSVGLMSINTNPLRDEPAGSQFPVPGAQYLGTQVVTELALRPSAGWPDAGLVGAAERFRLDPLAVRGSGGPDASGPVRRPLVQAHGPVVLESLRRVSEGDGIQLEARFVNYLPEPHPLDAELEGTWWQSDLAGAPVSGPVDLAALVVPAGGILTLRREE